MIDHSELKRLAEAVRDLEDSEHLEEWIEAREALFLHMHCHTILELIAEIERLREVTKFEDAVACVFDCLKMTAANTGSREWDDQLEDLAEEVIEYAPKYKKQWKDICDISRQRDQLKAENEALRKDAERYRAIRDDIPHVDLGRAILEVQTSAEYDAAVDAMSKDSTHD